MSWQLVLRGRLCALMGSTTMRLCATSRFASKPAVIGCFGASHAAATVVHRCHVPPQGLPHTAISVCGWVKVHRHKTYNRIMSHEWVNWGWNLYADGNGVVRFGIGQVSGIG